MFVRTDHHHLTLATSTTNKPGAINAMLLVVLTLLVACARNGEAGAMRDETTKEGKMAFEAVEVDLGTLEYGDVVGAKYRMTNVGEGAIVIVNVETDCGCTTTKYQKDLIGAGETTVLEVIFDTKGQSGYQYKTVRVTAESGNGKTETVKLILKARVN